LRYRKRRSRSIISTLSAFSFGEKIAKAGPAYPEIICLLEISKKENYKKRKKEGN